MPRTDITVTVAPGPYPLGPTAIVWTAADPTNFNSCVLTGKEIILARNTTGGSLNVTLTGSADVAGRSSAVSHPVAAGATAMWGPFSDVRGWAQGTKLFFGSTAAGLLFAVIRTP